MSWYGLRDRREEEQPTKPKAGAEADRVGTTEGGRWPWASAPSRVRHRISMEPYSGEDARRIQIRYSEELAEMERTLRAVLKMLVHDWTVGTPDGASARRRSVRPPSGPSQSFQLCYLYATFKARQSV